jgi:hypothetical protein
LTILQDRLVQAELGHELLEPSVLVVKLLQLPDLVRLHPRVLTLPSVKRLFRNPDLPDHVQEGHPELGLLEHRHDLLNRKSNPLHGKLTDRPAV